MSFFRKLFGKEEGQPPERDGVKKEPVLAPRPLEINEISPAELKARLDNGENLMVVDLRQPWEYHAGHIPSAVNIFLQHIPARATELPQDRDIVLQCWHGFTSLDAAGYLIQNGWPATRVRSLKGGMAGWVQVHGVAGLEKAG